METNKNTILVTGGASGYGLQVAKELAQQGNKVIITGNCSQKLACAAAFHPNITPVYHDITDDNEITALVQKVVLDFPGLNAFINNAGHDFGISDAYEANPCPDRLAENYFSGIRIAEELLLSQSFQKNATIIDLSPLSLSEIEGVKTFDTIKRAISSYYNVLSHVVRKKLNVNIYNVFNLGLDSGSAPDIISKKIAGIFSDDTPGPLKSPDDYVQYHSSPLWAICTA